MDSKVKRRAIDKAERMRAKQEKELRQRHEEAERLEKEQWEPKEMLTKGYKIINGDEGEIDSGNFAKIYHATVHQRNIVVKIIEKDGKDENFLDRISYVAKIIKLLNSNHENIIPILDVFETQKRVLIFMELSVNGNLRELLRKQSYIIPEGVMRKFARELALALCYLHINDLAHGNIKLENILLGENYTIKLSGFTHLTVGNQVNSCVKSRLFVGNAYSPRELLLNETYEPKALDIWMYGVVIFYIINNRFPFDSSTFSMLVSQQKKEAWRTKLDPETPQGAINLLENCFKSNLKERITAPKLLTIPWLKCNVTVLEEISDEFDQDDDKEVLRPNILEKIQKV